MHKNGFKFLLFLKPVSLAEIELRRQTAAVRRRACRLESLACRLESLDSRSMVYIGRIHTPVAGGPQHHSRRHAVLSEYNLFADVQMLPAKMAAAGSRRQPKGASVDDQQVGLLLHTRSKLAKAFA